MDAPELVTLLPEEEEQQETPDPSIRELRKKFAVQIVTVILLKVATGLAVRNLTRTVREIDILYPENMENIRWKA